MHAAIQTNHFMVGVDSHDGILALGDVPKPMPHLVSAGTRWLVPPKMTTRVFGTGGSALICKGSDIGIGIPHIPTVPNLLAPLCTLASGSKSYFGPSRVRVEDQIPAGALLGAVDPNLNCAGPTKVPATALVMAPNTVHYEMSLGDILAGALGRAADAWMQYGINRAFGSEHLTRFIGRYVHGPLVRRMVSTKKLQLSLDTALLLNSSKVLSNKWAVATLSNLSTTMLGFMAGSPLSNSLGGVVAQTTGNDAFEHLSPVGAATSALAGLAESAHGVDELLDPPDVETMN